MPTALAMAALLVPLGALAVLQARNGLLIAESIRGRAEAHAAAEGVLEWTAAALRPDAQLESVLAGPDGRAGTADDGQLPFGIGFNPLPPARASIRVEPAGADSLRLVATGQGWRGANVTLERLVHRGADPFSPAAVAVTGPLAASLGSGSFVVDGVDHRPAEPIGSGSGGASPLPGLCAATAVAEETVRAGLDSSEASRLRGRGGPPSLAQEAIPDLAALAARAAAHPEAVRLIAGSLPTDLVAGAPGVAQLTVIDGDARIEGEWSGVGVLVVRGRLQVTGRLSFDGLVLATGGMRVETEAEAVVRGSVWASGPALDLLGNGGIGACSTCIAAADAAFSGLLPHRLVVGSWREVW